MKQFIEFTTHHSERTYGNPVYYPEKLKRFRSVEGVRVDGELIDFRDPSIPQRLEQYLIESRRRKHINDCVAFVAIMNGIPFDGKSNPFQSYDRLTRVTPWHVDLSSDAPLVLAQGFHDMQVPRAYYSPRPY